MADVLREYLVSLGFNVDQAKLRSFNAAIKDTSKTMEALGAEVVGTTAALVEMVDRVARQFSDLYYLSQQTKSTVASLDAVSYAAQQVGISSEEATSAVANFAAQMRHNPGIRNLVEGMVGKGDPEAQMRGIIKRLSSQYPEYVAIAMAQQQFGIPENVFLNYRNNMQVLEEAEADHIRRMKEAGLNADEMAVKFNQFERVMGHLGDQIKIAGERIAVDLLPGVSEVVVRLDDMAGAFSRADTASGGLLGRITGLLLALGATKGVLYAISRVLGIAAPSVAAPALGLWAGWNMLPDERKNDTGRPEDTAAIAKLPWWQQLGIAFQKDVFGADPNQFLPGGNYGPGKGNTPFPPVGAGKPVPQPPYDPSLPFGGAIPGPDGLFNVPATPLPRPRPGGVTVNQTNTFNADWRDIDTALSAQRDTTRGFADALRFLGQKLQ